MHVPCMLFCFLQTQQAVCHSENMTRGMVDCTPQLDLCSGPHLTTRFRSFTSARWLEGDPGQSVYVSTTIRGPCPVACTVYVWLALVSLNTALSTTVRFHPRGEGGDRGRERPRCTRPNPCIHQLLHLVSSGSELPLCTVARVLGAVVWMLALTSECELPCLCCCWT
jgi:hypothetical protein